MNGVKEPTVSKQVKEQQPLVYTRPNGDDIMGNENLIDNIRDEQSRDIIDNCRVGNYDNRGNYVIDADIIKELIGMNKYIDRKAFEKVINENKSEIEFKLTGNIPLFGEMEFRLVVTKFDARLYLIEEVFREGGGYLETYGEKIADYVSDREEKDDLANIFTLFNISVIDEDDEDGGKKFKDEDNDVDKLLVRKIYLSLLAKNLVDYTAAEEKESFDKIVGILKEKGGEYGKRVLKNFIDRLERRPEIMGIKDKNGYNKALNDMLIGSLEVATTEEDMQDENIRKLFEEINGVRNKRTQDNINRAKQLVTAEQVKKIYDQLKGPGQGKLTLTDIQKTVDDTQSTLTKQDVSRRPAQPVLKQETRDAILKQTPRNEVVEQSAPSIEAAAIKKEEPAQGSAKKPDKKEEKKATVKKPSASAKGAAKPSKSSDKKPSSTKKDDKKKEGISWSRNLNELRQEVQGGRAPGVLNLGEGQSLTKTPVGDSLARYLQQYQEAIAGNSELSEVADKMKVLISSLGEGKKGPQTAGEQLMDKPQDRTLDLSNLPEGSFTGKPPVTGPVTSDDRSAEQPPVVDPVVSGDNLSEEEKRKIDGVEIRNSTVFNGNAHIKIMGNTGAVQQVDPAATKFDATSPSPFEGKMNQTKLNSTTEQGQGGQGLI